MPRFDFTIALCAKRMTADLGDVAATVYTRDLFGQD